MIYKSSTAKKFFNYRNNNEDNYSYKKIAVSTNDMIETKSLLFLLEN